jgi:HEAT repeat protein
MAARIERRGRCGDAKEGSAVRKLGVLVLAVAAAGCGTKSTGEWVEQLRSPDAALRLHAVKALGERGSEAAQVAPALGEALKDEDAFVRRDAALALGRLGPEAKPAVPNLVAALRDKKPAVRKAAAEALKTIDPETAAQRGLR